MFKNKEEERRYNREWKRRKRAPESPEEREKRLAGHRASYYRHKDARSAGMARYRAEHREELRLAEQERRRNPEFKAATRAYQLKKFYGLTQKQYDEMYAAQEGKCAICKVFFEVLPVDHDHVTGQTRKLLCHNCNMGLGKFKDSPELLFSAADYLMQMAAKAKGAA